MDGGKYGLVQGKKHPYHSIYHNKYFSYISYREGYD